MRKRQENELHVLKIENIALRRQLKHNAKFSPRDNSVNIVYVKDTKSDQGKAISEVGGQGSKSLKQIKSVDKSSYVYITESGSNHELKKFNFGKIKNENRLTHILSINSKDQGSEETGTENKMNETFAKAASSSVLRTLFTKKHSLASTKSTKFTNNSNMRLRTYKND